MRTLAGIAAVTLACLLASPAWAEPTSVPFVTFGGEITAAGDVNGDGHEDVVTTVRSEGSLARVLFGPFRPGEVIAADDVSHRGFVLRGTARENALGSVTGAGDVNGDELDDVLVGAPNEGFGRGRAYVVFGDRRPPDIVRLRQLGNAGITVLGKRYKVVPDGFGSSVAPLGDMNRDGFADVAVTALGGFVESPQAAWRPGSAYAIFGRRRGGTIAVRRLGRRGVRIGSTALTIYPKRPALEDVYSLRRAGDWNADGRGDLLLSGFGRRRACAWIVYGGRHRYMLRSQPGMSGLIVRCPRARDPFAAASGADVDADGTPDVVLGAPWTRDVAYEPAAPPSRPGGTVWIVRGRRSPRTVDLRRPDPKTLELTRGDPSPAPSATVLLGASVDVGRFDGDEVADVVLTTATGIAVIYGKRSPSTTPLSTLTRDIGFFIPFESPGDMTVATVEDINGDRRDDVLVNESASGPTGMQAGSDATGYLLFSPSLR